MADALTSRIDAIEEAYEFMLAYAAQGLTDDAGTRAGGQLRELLARAIAALTGLEQAIDEAVGSPSPQLPAFRAIVVADAARCLAVFQLVAAQSSISSQLVDNLNASLHVRTLLTDLFLLDEILKPGTLAL